MKNLKRLISIAISVAILLIIYSKIDFRGLLTVFTNSDGLWMTVSLGMVVPITLFTSWRLQLLMPAGATLGFLEANRLILAASTLNMILPSKMGDIAKAYFIKDRGHLSGSLSLSLVVFEKTCDMLSLLLWCVLGLMFYPQQDSLFALMTVGVASGLVLGLLMLGSRQFASICFSVVQGIVPKTFKVKVEKLHVSWDEMHTYFWRDKIQLLKISVISIFIWFLHLLQIWLFILALNAWVPFLINLALSPLSILAGLLPLTFAGVGTRDAALIVFYQPYFDATTGAALGLLCTSRYFLPAIGGLPFLGNFLSATRQ